MIELPLDETWYGSSRIFPSGALAREAYARIGEHDHDGRLAVGVYRHQRIGLDAEPVLVTVGGLRREGVEQAERLLGGEEVSLHPSTWLQLVARRLEVVAAMAVQDLPSGHYVVRHPPGGRRL